MPAESSSKAGSFQLEIARLDVNKRVGCILRATFIMGDYVNNWGYLNN